jgi:hypothetical protein
MPYLPHAHRTGSAPLTAMTFFNTQDQDFDGDRQDLHIRMGAPLVRHAAGRTDVAFSNLGQLHGKPQKKGSYWEPLYNVNRRGVPSNECSHSDPFGCTHEIPHELYGPTPQYPMLYNSILLGSKLFKRLGDPNEYVLTTTPTGTYCTVNGILAPIPPEAIQWHLTKTIPISTVLNSRLMGKPQSGKDQVPDWEPAPPIPISIGPENNPYKYEGGGAVEIMPHHGSRTTNQLLIFSTAQNAIFKRREQAMGDRHWEEQIPLGVESHAKFCHDRWNLHDMPIGKFKYKDQKGMVDALEIKPGLRGGGEASLKCYLPTKTGEWNISGYMLNPGFYGNYPPTVMTHEGRLEPVFMPGICNKRIRNSNKAAAMYGGGAMGGKEKDWVTMGSYSCWNCGSDDHGLIDCPVHRIHTDLYGQNSVICAHCTQTGHILVNCPFPPQFFPNRVITLTLQLYIHTLHWKQTLLKWSCETGVVALDSYERLKKHIMSPSNGAPRHPFGLHGPCPDCDSSHHQTQTQYWIHKIVEEEERWFYINRTSEEKRAGMEFHRQDYDKLCNWYVDRRFCPAYWMLYHPMNGNGCFVVYNPLSSTAFDALNRVYLRCQGWQIKTPIPIPGEHIWKRVENPEGRLVSMRPELPSYDVAKTFDIPKAWVKSSGDDAFNDIEFQ